MILDATAGNRVIWKKKHDERIIYLDVEKKLETKPTIIADNTQTPFKDGIFSTIFYDPPHTYSFNSIFYSIPDAETYRKNHPKDNRKYPSYYGTELYKNKSQLYKQVFLALKEFTRILREDGLLWFNWSELDIPLGKIIAVFTDWETNLKLAVSSPHQQLSECKNWWLCLAKKTNNQASLLDF